MSQQKIGQCEKCHNEAALIECTKCRRAVGKYCIGDKERKLCQDCLPSYCPKCKNYQVVGWFCEVCGTELVVTPVKPCCEACGASLSEYSSYCGECGAKVKKSEGERRGVMVQQPENPTEVKKPVETEAKPDYDLHIKVPAEMRQTLKDSAELAFKLHDIPKPDLVDLMNLFIGWGLQIQKQKWLERVGYR